MSLSQSQWSVITMIVWDLIRKNGRVKYIHSLLFIVHASMIRATPLLLLKFIILFYNARLHWKIWLGIDEKSLYIVGISWCQNKNKHVHSEVNLASEEPIYSAGTGTTTWTKAPNYLNILWLWLRLSRSLGCLQCCFVDLKAHKHNIII